jgi:hypothetical protein
MEKHLSSELKEMTARAPIMRWGEVWRSNMSNKEDRYNCRGDGHVGVY